MCNSGIVSRTLKKMIHQPKLPAYPHFPSIEVLSGAQSDSGETAGRATPPTPNRREHGVSDVATWLFFFMVCRWIVVGCYTTVQVIKKRKMTH